MFNDISNWKYTSHLLKKPKKQLNKKQNKTKKKSKVPLLKVPKSWKNEFLLTWQIWLLFQSTISPNVKKKKKPTHSYLTCKQRLNVVTNFVISKRDSHWFLLNYTDFAHATSDTLSLLNMTKLKAMVSKSPCVAISGVTWVCGAQGQEIKWHPLDPFKNYAKKNAEKNAKKNAKKKKKKKKNAKKKKKKNAKKKKKKKKKKQKTQNKTNQNKNAPNIIILKFRNHGSCLMGMRNGNGCSNICYT